MDILLYNDTKVLGNSENGTDSDYNKCGNLLGDSRRSKKIILLRVYLENLGLLPFMLLFVSNMFKL